MTQEADDKLVRLVRGLASCESFCVYVKLSQ